MPQSNKPNQKLISGNDAPVYFQYNNDFTFFISYKNIKFVAFFSTAELLGVLAGFGCLYFCCTMVLATPAQH
jgi:hypothetical protein